MQRNVLLALEDAGVFTSGGLVKDKVIFVLISGSILEYYRSYFQLISLEMWYFLAWFRVIFPPPLSSDMPEIIISWLLIANETSDVGIGYICVKLFLSYRKGYSSSFNGVEELTVDLVWVVANPQLTL